MRKDLNNADTISDTKTENQDKSKKRSERPQYVYQKEPNDYNLVTLNLEQGEEKLTQNKSKQIEIKTDKPVLSTDNKDGTIDKLEKHKKDAQQGTQKSSLTSYLERENWELKKEVTASERMIKNLIEKVQELEKIEKRKENVEICLQNVTQELTEKEKLSVRLSKEALHLNEQVRELEQVNTELEIKLNDIK